MKGAVNSIIARTMKNLQQLSVEQLIDVKSQKQSARHSGFETVKLNFAMLKTTPKHAFNHFNHSKSI